MTLERPNLAGAFNSRPPVDRAAGLTGLLPPARPVRRLPAPEPDQQDGGHADVPAADLSDLADGGADLTRILEADPSPAVRQRSTPTSPRTVRSGRETPTAKRPVSQTADTVVNVAVYLEPDLLHAARDRHRTTATTYDELVVAAFAAVPDVQLRAHLHPAAAPALTAGMPARQRRPRGTAGIQIQLRLTGQQRDWLADKQTDLDAPSRSALVAAALRLYLGH